MAGSAAAARETQAFYLCVGEGAGLCVGVLEKERNREREGQTDRQTERERRTDRQSEGGTDRQRTRAIKFVFFFFFFF